MKGSDCNLSLTFKINLCGHIKSFTFQKLEFKLHREGDVLVITIHNLQKTKVKFVIIMECINLSVVPPNVICELKYSSCLGDLKPVCLHRASSSECSRGKSCNRGM
jgi:hypothetical protein